MIGKIGGQRNEIKLVPGKGSVSEKPKCNGVSVEKKKAYEFEHWRELRFTCGGKTLSIYPDGGFANGWNLDTDYYHAEHKHFDHEKARYDTAIHIKRDKDIKFDYPGEGYKRMVDGPKWIVAALNYAARFDESNFERW